MTPRTHVIAGAIALATMMGMIGSAMAQSENCSPYGETNPDTQIGVCTALIQSGKWQGKQSAWVFFARGQAYLKKGQYDPAIQDFDQAIKLDPTDANSFVARGIAYGSKGQYDRAISDIDQALKLDPTADNNITLRGQIYNASGQYDRAIQDFDLAIKLNPPGDNQIVNPRNANALFNRGIAYKNKGQYDRAIQDYDLAIKLLPNFAFAFYERGLAKQKNGDAAGGAADIAKARQLQPGIGQ